MDAHLEYLRRVSKIVSMPELWNSFCKSPLAVIVIDDGLVENLELKEIFQKHRVRPMIYLCTGTVRAGGGFWWLSVGSESEVETLKTLDNRLRKKTLYEKGFEHTKKATPGQAVPVEALRSILDWADLGAHTRFHPVLTRCEDKECEEEILLSRTELLPFIGATLDDFAYPNGEYSEREVDLAKNAGFASARTCDPGWNNSKSDRFRLKAILMQDDASIDKFAVQLTGIPALARTLIRKLLCPFTKKPNAC
jgi:peptidoglycan/xylan/chitin deacetylase (PgdA/CDA1 family)